MGRFFLNKIKFDTSIIERRSYEKNDNYIKFTLSNFN